MGKNKEKVILEESEIEQNKTGKIEYSSNGIEQTEKSVVKEKQPSETSQKAEAIARDLVKEIKESFFPWISKYPLRAYDNYINWTSKLLIVGIIVLVQFIFFSILFNKISNLDSYGVGSFFSSEFSGPVMFGVFVSVIIFILFQTVGVKIVASLSGIEDAGFKDSLGVVTITQVPIAALNLVGIILSLITPFFGIFISFINANVLFLGTYLGIQKHLGKPKKSPFWSYIITMMIVAIITVIVISITMASIIRNQAISTTNQLGNDLTNELNNLFQ